MSDKNGMLVLTRGISQSIMIGEEIEITVLSVDKRQVKIGIKAPRSVQVHREEVFKRIQEEQANAV